MYTVYIYIITIQDTILADSGVLFRKLYMLAKDFFFYRRLSRLAHIEGAHPFSHLQFLDPQEVCITRAYNRKPLTNKTNIYLWGSRWICGTEHKESQNHQNIELK